MSLCREYIRKIFFVTQRKSIINSMLDRWTLFLLHAIYEASFGHSLNRVREMTACSRETSLTNHTFVQHMKRDSQRKWKFRSRKVVMPFSDISARFFRRSRSAFPLFFIFVFDIFCYKQKLSRLQFTFFAKARALPYTRLFLIIIY